MKEFFHYRLRIEGFVQGIGFRPFVFKLAQVMSLNGWVNNDTEGVNIELEATEVDFEKFLQRLQMEKPALAQVRKIEIQKTLCGVPRFTRFEIHKSEISDVFAANVLPDLATCPECIKDITDVANRRYRYVFTNCTHCGPRFSIIEALPYDRKNTTMADFVQCSSCQAEYENSMDRRFHAQPNACAQCGPQLELLNQEQTPLAQSFSALERAVDALKQGQIVALKGIGGYQLVVDAGNSQAVSLLRRRKHRQRKPFAVMLSDVTEVLRHADLTVREEKELTSVAAPIVLLKKKAKAEGIADAVAPNNSYLGIFLPNTPLHYWILKLFASPLVVTSANQSDEPLVFTEPEVFDRLNGLADLYLTHNRPIARPIDDSVLQVIEDRVFVLRAARGYAPQVFHRESELEGLATGPHMKNTFALALKHKTIVSQHLGDMETARSQDLFEREVENYLRFYHLQPSYCVTDAHPNYFTTEWADRSKVPSSFRVQHHRAHIYATLAENEVRGSFFGIAWDGTGYGDDGTIWGAEIFQGHSEQETLPRIGSIYPFRLLGGEAAVRSPWKVALALLFEIDIKLAESWFRHFHADKSIETFQVLHQMWQQQVNAPICSSMGRFLEGVSSLLGIVHDNEFEADAAMQLENAAFQWISPSASFPLETAPLETPTRSVADHSSSHSESSHRPPLVPLQWTEVNKLHLLDWRVWLLEKVQFLLNQQATPEYLAAITHDHLVSALFDFAQCRQESQLVLGGGVFQNRWLMGRILTGATAHGFSVFTPQRLPINDGGIALGQIYGHSLQKQGKFIP